VVRGHPSLGPVTLLERRELLQGHEAVAR